MAGETKNGRMWLRALMTATSLGLGALIGFGLIPLLKRGALPPWDDLLNAGIGLWLISCIPISILRWFAVPKARISNFIVRPLIVMGLSGVAMLLPVLGPQVFDRTLCMIAVLVIYLGSVPLSLMNQGRDEMMKRMSNDTMVITYWIAGSALFLYGAAERLGFVSGLTAWGMTGLLMVISFVAQFIVYYRLGMGPESQAESPA